MGTIRARFETGYMAKWLQSIKALGSVDKEVRPPPPDLQYSSRLNATVPWML